MQGGYRHVCINTGPSLRYEAQECPSKPLLSRRMLWQHLSVKQDARESNNEKEGTKIKNGNDRH